MKVNYFKGTVVMMGMLGIAWSVSADDAATTQPAAKALPADQLLDRMLDTHAPSAQPLAPVNSGGPDATTGSGALAPGAPALAVMREGTFIVDRVGRLVTTEDGQSREFVFESDGTTLQDPPLKVLPNLNLMRMERESELASRDLRFRITGMVTEYHGRNYILLEKAQIVAER